MEEEGKCSNVVRSWKILADATLIYCSHLHAPGKRYQTLLYDNLPSIWDYHILCSEQWYVRPALTFFFYVYLVRNNLSLLHASFGNKRDGIKIALRTENTRDLKSLAAP